MAVAIFRHLPLHLDPAAQRAVLDDLRTVVAAAPLYTPTMPRTGRPFSVRMSNCGPLGWVSDRDLGYRYQPTHPETGLPWPPIPERLLELWRSLTAYPHPPEACLINFYADGAKMGSHQDRDEQEPAAPVLSVSLGDDAAFHVGGPNRTDPKTRLRLASGDVLLLEGPSRFAFHGVDRIYPGTSMLLAGGGRLNLTLRRVTRPR
jgi:alkylated DNA repair protein (DNA oxidative demethylase)